MAGQTPALSHALHADALELLNQLERWFGLITQQGIHRGSFDSSGTQH
ncbi:protein of unknown function (plasmid) [Cupriavidus taiwanensis]|uniref:Uncharacterized protein n=1 Tax=Cupriavidus taiwanensis TaxID=164546 RepID=A0A375EGM4_9BURK|nr:protein of unknown function [Cupriavidus taiwanensis]SOZ72333.1 protein of unknown function [Cupriavidus taiwanensis]SOZ74627.1 protein of unknown function [Cupriavidus taiwanensis]SPA11438.1 protein of unknown function [Cupriavidus taiwanensis]SPD49169.1 protein of unknown function [Cupriavidus taiwanensis]